MVRLSTTALRGGWVAWMTVAVLAAAPVDTVDREVRKMFHSLELPQRFAEERAIYLSFMKSRGTPGTDRVINHIGQRLIGVDYETPLCAFLAAHFSSTEAAAINAYLATPIGKRQHREMHAIHKDMRKSPAGTVDPDARVAKFYAPLTRDEKKTVSAFTTSDAGKKYWAQLGPLDKKLTDIFSQFTDEILAKLASESGAPLPSPGKPIP